MSTDGPKGTRTAYCPGCKKETAQDGYEKNPANPHSYEQWECTECHWVYSGYSGNWNPPYSG